MFVDFFDWFCESLKQVFITMDKFILFNNFSYFDFACAILATGIIFKILKFIIAIEDEEPNFIYTSNYISQYDNKGYIPRHAYKKRRRYDK